MSERAPRAGFSLGVTEAEGERELVELVLFSVGRYNFVVARGEVLAIREPPRARGLAGEGRAAIPMVFLSQVLQLERDTAIDRRVLEVEYWEARLGLAVTAIGGIRVVPLSVLRPLPALVARNISSQAVLGLVQTEFGWAVALDLAALIAEHCEHLLA